MIYRTANLEDQNKLKLLGLNSYGGLKKYLTEENWKSMERFLAGNHLYPDLIKISHSFVCEEGSRILGMAFLVPSGNPTKVFPPTTSYIRMVGVDPAAQGKGIGKKLTNLCIEKAKAIHEKSIMLHTAEVLLKARHIYQQIGFKKIRKLDEHYGMEYWVYQLEI